MVTEENALHHLKQLREECNSWRQSKAYRNEKIPDEIWDKACELVPYIPLTRIVTSLKISLNTLKRLAQQKGFEPNDSGHVAKKPQNKKPAAKVITSSQNLEVTKVVIPLDESIPCKKLPDTHASKPCLHLSLTLPGGASAKLDIPPGTDNQMVQTIIASLGGLALGA